MLRRALISPALVLLALGAVSIPASAQNKPQFPTIHVSTHLVRIGVIVRGRKGPAKNLTKKDFVVLDRGKRRKISVFYAEAAARGESASLPPRPLPQGTFSNLPRYGAQQPESVTIVLLDSLNTLVGWLPDGPGGFGSTPPWLETHAFGRAKEHLVAFLKQLRPTDRVAIYGLGGSLQVLCDFTCNRAQLLAVVHKYDSRSRTSSADAEPGGAHIPGMDNAAVDADKMAHTAQINEARAGDTMAALAAIAAHVADIPGRKNLVWLTANLPVPARAVARLLARANIAVYPVDARGLLPREARMATNMRAVGQSPNGPLFADS